MDSANVTGNIHLNTNTPRFLCDNIYRHSLLLLGGVVGIVPVTKFIASVLTHQSLYVKDLLELSERFSH